MLPIKYCLSTTPHNNLCSVCVYAWRVPQQHRATCSHVASEVCHQCITRQSHCHQFTGLRTILQQIALTVAEKMSLLQLRQFTFLWNSAHSDWIILCSSGCQNALLCSPHCLDLYFCCAYSQTPFKPYLFICSIFPHPHIWNFKIALSLTNLHKNKWEKVKNKANKLPH